MLSARPAGLPLDADRGISTKTPGRALTKTRNVLQENAVRNVPMTVAVKGRKVVQNTPLQPKTLQTDRILKDPPGKQVGPSKSKDTPAIRPLGDKTPFPNHTANQTAVTGAKIAKPALVDGSLRPSSARKHERLPRSASKAFETPITDGKHWDVSDIDIEVDAPVANQSILEECHDEIEYMPPKVEDIPYEPPFEMPNYREVGKTLMALIRSHTLEDDPPSVDLTFTADASERNFFAQPVLPRPEIEDDSPFARAKPEPEIKPPPSTTPKQTSTIISKPVPRPIAQRATPATRTNSSTRSRVAPVVRRPATATAIARPPMTAACTPSSQPVTRASTSLSTLRAVPSRATTRAPSVARSAPLVRPAAATQLSRATSVSKPTTKLPVRSAEPVKSRSKTTTTTTRPSTSAAIAVKSPSDVSPNTGRPRSGTITKAAFESNAHAHMVVHLKNHSLEDVKKDLEGLIVFDEDTLDEDEFRFDV